jgi:Flp pilus assembly protein TadG
MRGPGVTARETLATARRRQKGHFERGAAAVEMALVMPLLILMVMGIIDFGRIFNGEIQLSQAAREGARVAALGFPEDPDVITRTRAALNNPAFQGGTATISVAVVDASGNAVAHPSGNVCVTSDSLDVANNYAQVTVSISYVKILFGPANLSQKAVMKCSG